MKERIINLDDRDLALVGLTVLAVVSLFAIEEPTTVITGAIAAIAGLAQGKNRDRRDNGTGGAV